MSRRALLCLTPLLLCLSLLGTLAHTVQAATVVVTNEEAFLAQLQAGFYAESFAGVTPGFHPSLAFAQNEYGFTASADASGVNNGVWANPEGAPSNLQTNEATDALVLALTGSPVNAIGGYFYAADNVGSFAPGATLTLSLSDGTQYTFQPESAFDFRGFISTAPLLSLEVSGSEQFNTSSLTIVGVTVPVTVPEPATALLSLLALPLLRRRMSRGIG